MKETPCPIDKGVFAKEFIIMTNNVYELNLTAAVALSEAARSAGVNTNEITDPETVQKIQKMLDMLDDLDDVQDVYHNGELPEEEEEDD